jgi:hypothetical protein
MRIQDENTNITYKNITLYDIIILYFIQYEIITA